MGARYCVCARVGLLFWLLCGWVVLLGVRSGEGGFVVGVFFRYVFCSESWGTDRPTYLPWAVLV